MDMWKQSNIGRWLRFGLVMVAVVMPSTKYLLADKACLPCPEGQESCPCKTVPVLNNDPTAVPSLLHSRSTQVKALSKRQARLDKLHQTIKEAIGQVEALADRTKEKDVKQSLYLAVKEAKNVRHTAKAKTLQKAKVDKALSVIKKIERNQKKGTEQAKAIADLREKLRHTSREIIAELASEAVSELIVIDSLPYTIIHSGSYVVSKDLDLVNASPTTAAITVTANDVRLDLGNHALTVSPTMTAIHANNVSNFTVCNGKLVTPAVSNSVDSVGLLLNGVSHAIFDTITFQNTRRGAFSQNSQDLTFTNCRFNNPADEVGRGIEASTGTKNLHVENCVFGLMGQIAILLRSDNVDVETGAATIRSCKFLSSDGVTKKGRWGVYLATENYTESRITNVEISDCEFQHHDTAIAINEGKGVEIRHCKFTDQQDGIAIFGGLEVLVQDCAFDMLPGTDRPAILLYPFGTIAGIQIKDCICLADGGSAIDISLMSSTPCPSDIRIENCVLSADCPSGTLRAIRVSGLVVKDCIIRNSKDDDRSACIRFEASNFGGEYLKLRSHEVVVDNCLLTGGFIGCRLSGNTNCEIKNCTITDGVVGILLTNKATNNAIRNNTIFGNEADGIFVEASSTINTITGNSVINNGAQGIFVASAPNIVKGNTVSQNGGDGLLNSGGEANLFLENTSCGNGGANCTNLPAGLVVLPGSPAVAGGNTCCP